MYLAVDNPSDLVAVVLGVAVPVVAFRFFAPTRCSRSPTGGPRPRTWMSVASGPGHPTGVQEQLGLTVLDVQPVGLEGSAGSTPLRLRVAASEAAPERDLFAKLYAKSHVRADRSYKLGRTILYGALEDEAPFQSVRRFVEYEDYTLLRLSTWASRCRRRSGSWRSPPNAST